MSDGEKTMTKRIESGLKRTRIGTAKFVLGIFVEKVGTDAFLFDAWGVVTLDEAVEIVVLDGRIR